MTLSQLIDTYCSNRDVGRQYKRQLLNFARRLAERAGTPNLEAMRPEVVNQLLARDSGYAPDSRANFRRMYLSLSAFAKKRGLIKKTGKKDVAQVRRPKPVARGYSIDDARKLVEVLGLPQWLHDTDRAWLESRMQGTDIVRRLWWRAYLLACWDTGNPTDLRDLKRSELRDGVICRPRGKTATSGNVIFCRLNPSTIEAIAAMRWAGEMVFPCWGSGNNWTCLWRDYRRIATLARVGGSLKWLRSGSGTDFESQNPGRGNELLANSRQVFETHYLVRPNFETDRIPISRALVQ